MRLRFTSKINLFLTDALYLAAYIGLEKKKEEEGNNQIYCLFAAIWAFN